MPVSFDGVSHAKGKFIESVASPRTLWLEFCERYKAELKNPEVRKTIADIVQAARKQSAITLVYRAKDTEHNEAVVLQAIFKRIVG